MKYDIRSMENRFNGIMKVLREAHASNDNYLTATQICSCSLGKDNYTTSDVGSAGQILNVLALAGIVDKRKVQRTTNTFSSAYRLIELE